MLCFFLQMGVYLVYSQSLSKPHQLFLGIGAGLDYGGIGIKTEFVTSDNLSFFAGTGYNLLDLAYNAGVIYKITIVRLSFKKVRAFLPSISYV